MITMLYFFFRRPRIGEPFTGLFLCATLDLIVEIFLVYLLLQ